MNFKIEGLNYCSKFNREIDYELVKTIKPECIVENNGCGNCKNCKYKLDIEYKINHKKDENNE